MYIYLKKNIINIVRLYSYMQPKLTPGLKREESHYNQKIYYIEPKLYSKIISDSNYNYHSHVPMLDIIDVDKNKGSVIGRDGVSIANLEIMSSLGLIVASKTLNDEFIEGFNKHLKESKNSRVLDYEPKLIGEYYSSCNTPDINYRVKKLYPANDCNAERSRSGSTLVGYQFISDQKYDKKDTSDYFARLFELNGMIVTVPLKTHRSYTSCGILEVFGNSDLFNTVLNSANTSIVDTSILIKGIYKSISEITKCNVIMDSDILKKEDASNHEAFKSATEGLEVHQIHSFNKNSNNNILTSLCINNLN